MILVVLHCQVCRGTAGIGMDAGHAEFNMIESGGRIFGSELHVCARCARHTR